MNPKVSVIVPIYKVRDFIARCAHSLLGQTLQDIEYIFVDDSTPDDSMDILSNVIKAYPKRQDQIHILSHDVNKGLPSARNTGLSVASGEYIFHCDSDDFVETDMLEKMIYAAEAVDADLVWCDWYLSFEAKERYMKEPAGKTQEDVLNNILSGIMKYNVWNKIIRRSVYVSSGVQFPSGYGMGEDMTIIRLLPHVRSVAYVGQALYHYVRTNTEAFTFRISDKHLAALRYNTQMTVDCLRSFYEDKYDREIAYFLQNVKLPFIMTDNTGDYILWTQLYPESNRYIWGNKKISFRTRILQYCASIRLFVVIRAYNFILKHIIYGLIYR